MNQSQLISLLQYSQDTGIFEKPANAGSRGRKIGGYIVGCKNTIGYIVVSINKKKYYAHRLAWFYVHGEWPEHHIDHINGDRSDNRISNLRKSTNSENMQNIKGPRVDNKFNLLGVCFDKQRQKFLAQIKLNGKNKYLGRFDNPDLAHEAYMAAKRKFHEFNTI
jgi:hypothetical protein